MSECTYLYNGEWYTEAQLLNLEEFKVDNIPSHIEVQHILNNTGENTHADIVEDYSSVVADDEKALSPFTEVIEFAKQQLSTLKDRLAKIKNEKKRLAREQAGYTPGNVKITEIEDRIKALTKIEREIALRIEGRDVGEKNLRVKGLEFEIAELERTASTESVRGFVESNLQRLAKLSNSRDIDDINEAQNIIKFLTLGGTFDYKLRDDNPFFTAEEIFMTDPNDDTKVTSDLRLSEDTMQQYRDWATQAGTYKSTLDKLLEDIMVDMINSEGAVNNTYGDRKFSFEELVHKELGLKDVDWVSMWTMDITQGIFSTNGILPQVMFAALVRSIESKGAWSRAINEQIDEATPETVRELKELGFTLNAAGILGLGNAASWQFFKEITKEGNETGGLIQRFSREYYDALNKVVDKNIKANTNAALGVDYNSRQASRNKAAREKKKWVRENTFIIDVSRVPEIAGTTVDNEIYKQSLISILGQRGYDEQVEEQRSLIIEYENEKQSITDMLFSNEGNPATLSATSQFYLDRWIAQNDPKNGVADYNNSDGISFDGKIINSSMKYNTLVPRKYKVNITINSATNKFEFNNTTEKTGYHVDKFFNSEATDEQKRRTIEGNPKLSKFYDLMREVSLTIKEHTPSDLQHSMSATTLPAMVKSAAELLSDKKASRALGIIPAYKRLMERLRLSWGVSKQSDISYAKIDPTTGKPNSKVNDSFLRHNSGAIKNRMLIEKTRFLQDYNANKPAAKHIKSIEATSVFNLSDLTQSNLLSLNQYLHTELTLQDIQSGNITPIKNLLTPVTDASGNVTDYKVNIGNFIRNYSLHTIVQTQSFDLPRVAKYFANVTMAYAARNEALPMLEILKQHYESIKAPLENNVSRNILDGFKKKPKMDGLRVDANKQMEDWFKRVILDNYGLKHKGIFGIDPKDVKDDEGNISTRVPWLFSKKIYSDEERREIKDINKLLSKETNEQVQAKLQELKVDMGRERTATALFDNLMGWVRTLRLGYNAASAMTNFSEGVISNMMMSAQGQYFDPNEIYYGYGIVKSSFLKNATFGLYGSDKLRKATFGLIEASSAKKARKFMDKFRFLVDSKNELQKSTHKTISSRLDWANPHALNQRIEYINQMPLAVAIARSKRVQDIKIIGRDGTTVSSIYDAFDNNMRLKDEFRTDENIKTWENLDGEDYFKFNQMVHSAITLGHGNYHELRGMMIKSSTAGKALMMFKTWLPMQIYWRFAQEQDDILSGKVGFKGRYLSYGAGTGTIHGGMVGALMFGGPIGFITAGLGTAYGAFISKTKSVDETGINAFVPMLLQSLECTGQIAKRLIGMPVNILSGIVIGRKIIKQGDKAFENWVGKGNFNKQDAANMRANMADISMQLMLFALYLMAKAMFWDDDKDKGKVEGETAEQKRAREQAFNEKRAKHNIVVNKLMQLSDQAGMYSGNVTELWRSTIQHAAVVDYVGSTSKFLKALNDWTNDEDVLQSGPNQGKSSVVIQAKKLLMPGLFKDTMFGFEGLSHNVFSDEPYDQYFKSDANKDASSNKRRRATRTIELKEEQLNYIKEHPELDFSEYDVDKAVKQQLNQELPTPAQLKKMGVTRKEYEEYLKNNQ